MKRLNAAVLGSGIAIALLAAVWSFAIAPALLHPGADYTVDLVYEAESETRTGPSEAMDRSRFTEEHKTRVVALDESALTMEISARFIDLATGGVLFEDASRIRFDPDTLRLENSKAYAFFPHHLEPDDYLLKQFTYFPDEGVLFRFHGTDSIEGAQTYRFDFEASNLDWTDSYDFALEPGAKIMARDWGSVWVEPTTGVLLKHTEDWITSIVGGTHDGVQIDVGHMWLSPDTITKQVFFAQNDRRTHFLYEGVIPGSLTFIGVILVAAGFRRSRER